MSKVQQESDQLMGELPLSPSATLALVEEWLNRLLPVPEAPPEPLLRAMRYAVFSGGRRLRPRFLLQAAQACGVKPGELGLALRAACAVELVHTALLVHDDLPCFDDAAERRGRPTVHVVFGEPLAVLTGDALLAHSFDLLANAPRAQAPRLLRLLRLLVRATGSCVGKIGGQSQEQEPAVSPVKTQPVCAPEAIERYHGMKTGVLFGTAGEMAAVAAGSEKAADWAGVGVLFGKWYQLAHRLLDVRGRVLGTSLAPPEAPSSPSAVVLRAEESVRAQLQAILNALRKSVLDLAVVPAPMLAFLDALNQELQSATGGGHAVARPLGPATRTSISSRDRADTDD